MRSNSGKLVRFNSPSVGNYSSALYGSQQVIIEENAIGIMLGFTPVNLCEVLLHGEVVFNIDPDSLDDVTKQSRSQGEIF